MFQFPLMSGCSQPGCAAVIWKEDGTGFPEARSGDVVLAMFMPQRGAEVCGREPRKSAISCTKNECDFVIVRLMTYDIGFHGIWAMLSDQRRLSM